MRTSVVALVLACAAAQVAPASALLAGALALGAHDHDHAHAVSLVAEEGHLDLVLSHDERGHRDRTDSSHHEERATSGSEHDHVFHLADDEAAHSTPRRAGVAPAPPLATGVAALPAPIPLPLPRPALEPRTRSSDSLSTVVLRL